MTFEKRVFSRFWLNFFFQIKKMFFFSFASNQFETNLTFLGQIPSPIQLLVTIESPRTWQWARKKIWGLFPKTCFRWNGPLHESLKNISYFGLEFSRDWSGVDSVIESMRNLFWPFLITYRMFCVVAFVTPYKVHQIPFQKTFEQKEHPKGAPFASAFSVPLLRPPRNLLVKNEWYSGATKTSRWSSALRRQWFWRPGVGAPAGHW